MKNVESYLEKNILYSLSLPGEDGKVFDGLVEEISPSGRYVRIDFSWYALDTITVLEVVPAVGVPVRANVEVAKPLTGPGTGPALAPVVQTSESTWPVTPAPAAASPAVATAAPPAPPAPAAAPEAAPAPEASPAAAPATA